MEKKEYKLELSGPAKDGVNKTLIAEFNDITNQADGSLILKCGNTAVLATAVMEDRESDNMSYFPLKVDYEERFYAAGRILGGRFTRREGRPSDEAVLSGRIVDRTIRPLFDQTMRYDVQVVITVLSMGDYDPDVLAVNAASLALATSDIPWAGPASAVRVAKKTSSNEFEMNPTFEYKDSDDFEFDLLACGKDGNINMIEVGANEAPESQVADGLIRASEDILKLQEWQAKIVKEIGKEKRVIEKKDTTDEVKALYESEMAKGITDAMFSSTPGKKSIKKFQDKWGDLLREKLPEENISLAFDYLEEKLDEELHRGALEDSKRADGRGMDEVRPLYAQAGGITENLHGVGLFYRGGTHVLSVLTLGGPDDVLLINGMEVDKEKRYIHHYNFPPFSVGESGRVGGFNRRMIGHGALAEKALLPMIPGKDNFPYTIRIVSEALASNGSTSMASVCGSTLALMDAGVPIKKPVAGIASGLMTRHQSKLGAGQVPKPEDWVSGKDYVLLTDIQGPEDHYGDMDFKVAGTRDGITAMQMDVKVDGVPIKILTEALEKAKQARLQILDVIEKEIPKSRADINKNAPKILVMTINPDQIGLIIGSGGKTIKDTKERSGAEINVEDDGTVYLTGKDGSAEKAKTIIEALVKEWVIGEEADATIVKIVDFGAFASIGGQTEGLIHISEIAGFRVDSVSDFLKEGDVVPVKVVKVENGKIGLSIKARDPKWAEGRRPQAARGPAQTKRGLTQKADTDERRYK